MTPATPVPADGGGDGAVALDPALVRRLDWRLLLDARQASPPERAIIVGGPPGIVDVARRIGMARTVSSSLDAGPAEVVAVLAPARAEAADIARALEPGGRAYIEIDRRGLGLLTRHPDRPASLLWQSGLNIVERYWVVPTLDVPSAFLPLDASRPTRWFLANVSSPRARLRALAGRVAAIAARRPALLAWIAPAIAVVAERPPPSAERETLVDAAARLNPSLVDPGSSTVALTFGDPIGSRVVLLPFDASADQPRLILKAWRLAHRSADIEREQRFVREFTATLTGPTAGPVPVPAGSFTWAGLAVGMEEYRSGTPLNRLAPNVPTSRLVAALHAVSEWLTRFHRETARPGTWNAARATWFRAIARDYLAATGDVPAERSALERLVDHAYALRGASLPEVVWHRDFAPWNVLLDDGTFTIIDWESARRGPSLIDIAWFVLHWSRLAHRHQESGWEIDHRQVFLQRQPDSVAAEARRAIRSYCDAVGVDGHLLPILLFAGVLDTAVAWDRRLRAAGVASTGARERNPVVPHVESLAALIDEYLAPRDHWWAGSRLPRLFRSPYAGRAPAREER